MAEGPLSVAPASVNSNLQVRCFVNHYTVYSSRENMGAGRGQFTRSPPHLTLSHADFCAEAVSQATGGMAIRGWVEEVWLSPQDGTILKDRRFRE